MPWLMLLPALVLLAAFTYWPIAGSVWESLHTQAPGVAPMFSGADQFAALLDDPVFLQALRNNFWYALVTVPVSVMLALAMALWVNERFAGRGLLRLAFFTPTILPMVAAANVWLFFYAPDIGLFNQLLGAVGIAGRNWLGDVETVLPALMVHHHLEGGGLLHDLLPRRAPVDLARTARRGAHRGAVRLVPAAAGHAAAAGADHAVRGGQRADQRVQAGRSPVRAHARRAEQRQHAAALLPL